MNAMDYTKFNDYSHAELRRMAQALDPGGVMAASDPWRRASDTLKAIRATLTRASTETALTWEGATSDAFHSRMLHLANTINNAASYANDAANTLKSLSEAIAKAKRDMPEEPSGWDQFTDGVGDTVSALFGGDDEDTKTAIAQQKKVEAAAVMQTLAMHYRVAAPILKPPLPPPPPPKYRDDVRDVSPTDSSDGAPALSAVMTGIGYAGTGSVQSPSSSPVPRLQKAGGAEPKAPTVKATSPAPTDSGIKGGTAQSAPKPLSVVHHGPGTGADGARATAPLTSGTNVLSTTPGSPATPGILAGPGGSGPGVPGPTGGGGPVFGPPGGVPGIQGKAGAQGDGSGRTNAPGRASAQAGTTFGAGEVYEGGYRAGGRAAAGERSAASLPGRSGTAFGDAGRSGGGSGAKQAFTEGGSGLGARNRVRSESSTNAASGMGTGMPLTDRQRRKKDEERGGKRPDYLTEDEETWASDKPVNPNVVE
ncbi:WXG100 family type VII secretion target [Kitasatospora hibisci]|uniref:WXG100 family type VII secretion target n=1 Tax=Kitasatospora hibisci TaxID=3369522 RepID=UPI0037553B82